MTTTLLKTEEIKRSWFLVDATGKPAGRLAVEIATRLRGKDKPTYAPHMDTGDFIVVINAEKVKLSGSKEDKNFINTTRVSEWTKTSSGKRNSKKRPFTYYYASR